MKLKFVIHTYDGQPRSMVWDCKDKAEIDAHVEYLISDTTGNTERVTFSVYVPPHPKMPVIEQAGKDAIQLIEWYSPNACTREVA